MHVMDSSFRWQQNGSQDCCPFHGRPAVFHQHFCADFGSSSQGTSSVQDRHQGNFGTWGSWRHQKRTLQLPDFFGRLLRFLWSVICGLKTNCHASRCSSQDCIRVHRLHHHRVNRSQWPKSDGRSSKKATCHTRHRLSFRLARRQRQTCRSHQR